MFNWQKEGRLPQIVELSESPRNVVGRNANTMTPPMVSPIASIVRDLSRSTLSSGGTPQSHKRESPVVTSANRKLDFSESPSRSSNAEDHDGLFNEYFNLKSTPDGSVKRKPKVKRLLGMAARRILGSPAMPSADKENGSALSSPVIHNTSPQKIAPKATKISRQALEDCDPNSQDSGYGASFQDREETEAKDRDGFVFAEPLGVAPRRMSVESASSVESPVRSSPIRSRRSSRRSLSSDYGSMEDGFNEMLDIDSIVERSELPNGIGGLLSGDIVTSDEVSMECDAATTPDFAKTKPRTLRRSVSFQTSRNDASGTPPMSKVRSCLFRSPNAPSSAAKLTFDENPRSREPFSPVISPSKASKRPEPPTDESPALVKRSRKACSLQEISETITSVSKPVLQRSFSETEAHAHIKSAIHRSTTDNDLTGDFSKPCILPLAEGSHDDLKSISSETLAGLIRGDFEHCINSFTIVDCRYPYEFEGGHIDGAVNLYSKDLIEERLLNPLTQTPKIQPDSNKRNILVFHCEFSWERGPNLSRFLRNIDRQRNKDHYPALHYPEVYLLHGGYQQFFQSQKMLCSPQSYRPMKHPDHEADLRQFRSKSKTWQGERSRTGIKSRGNFKRLGF